MCVCVCVCKSVKRWTWSINKKKIKYVLEEKTRVQYEKNWVFFFCVKRNIDRENRSGNRSSLQIHFVRFAPRDSLENYLYMHYFGHKKYRNFVMENVITVGLYRFVFVLSFCCSIVAATWPTRNATQLRFHNGRPFGWIHRWKWPTHFGSTVQKKGQHFFHLLFGQNGGCMSSGSYGTPIDLDHVNERRLGHRTLSSQLLQCLNNRTNLISRNRLLRR